MIIKLQFFSFLICFLMCGQIMADDKNYFGGTAKIDDQRSLIFVGKEIPNNYRVMCAELAGDFHLGDSRQLTDKSLLPFDLVS